MAVHSGTSEQRLRNYVRHVYLISKGNSDKVLLAKTNSLDDLFPNGITQEWMDFIGSAHDENKVQMGLRSPNSYYDTSRHRREHILNKMFSKYGLLNGAESLQA